MASRRSFLAVGALVASAGPVAASGERLASTPTPTPYDRATFFATLARPAAHRQCAAISRVDGSAPLAKLLNSLNGYAFGWGEGPGTVHALAVFYDGGVPYAFGDRSWDRFGFAAMIDRGERLLPRLLAFADTPRLHDVYDASERIEDAVHGTPAPRGNPYLHARGGSPADRPDDPRGYWHDASIETLARRGVSFAVCDNALHAAAAHVVATRGGEQAEIVRALHADLVPGAMLVPAGTAALDAAQQAHFTLLAL